MIARFALLLIALMSAASSSAATWYVQGSDSLFGSFEFTEAGGYGGLDLYWNDFPGPLPFSVFVGGDASALAASSPDTGPGFILTLEFETALTDLGGIVAVAPYPESSLEYVIFNGCYFEDPLFCLDTGVTSVTTTSPVPLPNTVLLVLAAVGGLVVLRSRQQPRNREQHSVFA